MLALAVFVAVAIFVVTLRGAYASVAELSHKLIGHTTQRTKAELDGFFTPVKQLLGVASDWGRAGELELGTAESMNRMLMPVVRETPVSSLLIARGDGAEYMLLRTDTGWTNRLTLANSGGVSRLLTWDDSAHPMGSEERKLDYDPRKRPWFQGAMTQKGGATHFTAPYTFFTTKDPGITASRKFRAPGESIDRVVAFDVKLMDISEFTTSLQITEGARLVVMTGDGRVIGLPKDERFRGDAAIKRAVLKTPRELGLKTTLDLMKLWNGTPRSVAPTEFESAGDSWWGGIERFELAPGRNLWILVAVPEADLVGRATGQRNLILLILFVLMAGILLTMVLLDRALSEDVKTAVQQAKRLGQYTLEEKLGEGGMGEVYRASHAMLRRPTAIKLLHAEKAKSETALSRFEREVQITAELTHPNTIAVYDFGHTPQGDFYYAMEYIEGVTLQDLVRRTGPMDPGRVIFVLTQVCGSLQEAHDRGLIHRDIKPANIMLCERGGMHDVVKVLDFGLVKTQESAGPLQLTRANALTGTPLYMPPEAATDPSSVDARSDVYALGAVAFYLVCGRPVFEGSSIIEILTQHLTVPAPRPSTIHPGVPADLEQVILACLAKTPADRPASARELSERLLHCEAANQWSQQEAKRWWHQHQTELERPAKPPELAHDKTLTVAIPKLPRASG